MARPVPEINGSSMADIAFLLLIFFLVTTTMDVDKGISRMLPPPPDPNAKPPDIKKRNIFTLLVNNRDMVAVDGDRVSLRDLKGMVKEFIANPYEKENLSEKRIENIDLLGERKVSRGVISLQNDRGTSYEMYIKVQNEITAAFNELKNEMAKREFGLKYADLQERQAKAIDKAIPLAISEAEPKEIKN